MEHPDLAEPKPNSFHLRSDEQSRNFKTQPSQKKWEHDTSSYGGRVAIEQGDTERDHKDSTGRSEHLPSWLKCRDGLPTERKVAKDDRECPHRDHSNREQACRHLLLGSRLGVRCCHSSCHHT